MKINAYNGAIIFGDAHRKYDEYLNTAAICLIFKAEREKKIVVLNGDTLDLVFYGKEKYEGSGIVTQLRNLSYDVDLYFVVGNHTGMMSWAKELFKNSNVKVVKSLDVTVNNTKWHIEHGDRFSIDWGPFGWLYLLVVQAFLRIAPKFWLKLMRPWLPREVKKLKGGDSQQYTRLTGIIWSREMDWAAKHNTNFVGNHTHKTFNADFGRQLLDAGDINDGSFVNISADGCGQIGTVTDKGIEY
jgi:UDP-2,3-diacylglucosamine pyrophosphatase LpxH